MWIISLDVDYVTRIMSVTGLCQSLGYIGFGFPLFWILDSRIDTSFLVPLLTYLLVVTTGRIPPQRSKVKQLFVRYNSPEVHIYIQSIYLDINSGE